MTGNHTTSTTGKGGAIYVRGSATVTVTNCTLSGNSAVFGGAIFSLGTLTVSGSTLSNNSTTTNGGGGIYLQAGTTTVNDSTLSGNSAAFGGGIADVGGQLIVNGSTFMGNSASASTGGGGLYTQSTTPMTVINSTFSGNSAINGGGLKTVQTAIVTNSTFYGNSATNNGGGINSVNNTGTTGILNLNNSIIASSTSGGDCHAGSGGTINAQNSLIQDNLNCVNGTNTGNLTGNPSLGALTTTSPAYYPLNSDSIAINAGDNSLIPAGITNDEAGNPRIRQGTVDLGAYESSYTTPVTQIAFGQQPTDTVANQTISPAITVLLKDVRGNLVTTAADNVTLAINNNPGGGNLGGTATVSAVGGVATFSDLSIDAVGTGYTLDASVIGLTNATSNPFNITALPISIDQTSSYLVITDSVNAVAEGATIGDRFAFQLTQTPSSDVTVTFSSTDPTQLEMIDFTVIGRYQPVGSYSITFSATNATGAHTVPWNTPVVINLYGMPDTLTEGAQTYGIHFAFSSSDPAYNNLAVPDEPVTVYDPGITNSPTSLTLAEGTSGSYTVVLDAPPGFLALPASLGGSQSEQVTVTANGVDYVFDRSNWNVPQTVTVSAPPNDGTCTGSRDVSVTESVTSNISLNPYMDSANGGPSSPAPNVTAPDEIIHVTDPSCTTANQINRVTPPAVNGAAPNTVSPGGNAPSGSGALPPSVEAPGAP